MQIEKKIKTGANDPKKWSTHFTSETWADLLYCFTCLLYPPCSRAGRLPNGKRPRHAAGLPDGPGPGRFHHQPDHLGAGGVSLGCRPGHCNGLKHRHGPAQLLHHRAGGRFIDRQARSPSYLVLTFLCCFLLFTCCLLYLLTVHVLFLVYCFYLFTCFILLFSCLLFCFLSFSFSYF